MIIDSDLIMQNDNWKQSIEHMLIDNDCVLALEPSQFFITHPCFMVFPSKTVNEIDFLAGVYDLKADTGRLVGLQLHDFKMRIKFLHPIKAYGGALGYVYPEINAHHVTSVSIRQLSRNMLGKSVFKMQVAENWRKWLVFSKVSSSMNLFSIRILQIGFVFVQIPRLAKFWIISKFKL